MRSGSSLPSKGDWDKAFKAASPSKATLIQTARLPLAEVQLFKKEILDESHDLGKMSEIHRLDHVKIGGVIVSGLEILRRLGGGHDQDRHIFQVRVPPDHRQHFMARQPGHF